MDNLKTTTDLVKDILERVPETRNSNNVLYYHVLAAIGKTVNEGKFIDYARKCGV